MFDKLLFLSIAVLVAVALLVAPASAVTITHGTTSIDMDFVPVDNPGNAGDPTRGAVDYTYHIGKYEVTEDQWGVVVDAQGGYPLHAGNWTGDQPVAEIRWHDMAMFCNWLTSGNIMNGAYTIDGGANYTVTAIDRTVTTYGNTVYVIPTEDEWYKAAYYDPNKPGGAGYYDFPTGSDTQPDGLDSSGDTEFEVVCDDGYNQGLPNDVDNAGSLSPYGTMGQGGNVYELTETEHSAGYCVMRGSSWGAGADRTGYNWRFSHSYTNEQSHVGFRVASIFNVPEGTTPGDADFNGDVDSDDAALLAANWQKMAGANWGEGDFNGDGIVNDVDATILATNWTAGVAVPEPGGIALLLCGLASLICWRRRR